MKQKVFLLLRGTIRADSVLSVCPASAHSVDAAQVPAGLRLPAPRQDIPCTHLHRHPGGLLRDHVDHQEHESHRHHLPRHGNIYLFIYLNQTTVGP